MPGVTMCAAVYRPPSESLDKCLRVIPAFAVLYHLDQLRVAQAIRSGRPDRLVVMQNGLKVSLETML